MKISLGNFDPQISFSQGGWGKLSMLVALIALSFIAVDISNRFVADNSNVRNNIALEPLTTVKSVQLSKTQLDQIKQQYTQFQKDDEEEKSTANSDIQGLTAEQQALQQGKLTLVFSGDNMLELKAVINNLDAKNKDNQNYALIRVTDVKSGQNTLQAIADQQSLFGYTLSVINQTSVKLANIDKSNSTQQGNDVQRDIYLMMYQQQISTDSNK
ncbi:MAG: hypothetical protein ACI936_000754 [Paraglaciecola sp.]|jgi:hypothetical protein